MTDPTNADLARQLLTHTLNDVQAHDDPERLKETQSTLTRFVEEDLAGRHPMLIAYTAQYAAQLAAWVALAATGDLEQAGALVRDVLLQSANAEANMPPDWRPDDSPPEDPTR
jgi:hypothetical protein